MSKQVVLIVEDDDETRELERWLLEDAGFYVVNASHGGEALALLDNVAPAVVVTDLDMPVIDGRELFSAIRKNSRLRSVPVVFATAMPQHAPAGVPVLKKPFSASRFVDSVREACPLRSVAAHDPQLRRELVGLADPRALVVLPLLQWISEQGADGIEAASLRREAGHRLRTIVLHRGWPTRSLVGRDGAAAAWRIVQQSLSDPSLARSSLPLLSEAALREEAALAHVALLTDRIRFFEGRAQVYGTQYGWSGGGDLQPWPIENAGALDDRRRSMGLTPIALNTARLRERMRRDGAMVPPDLIERRQAIAIWAKRLGWRSNAGSSSWLKAAAG